MVAALIALWILNAVDACGTYYFIAIKHVATEANPLMAWAIHVGWPFFFMIKFGLMAALISIASHYRGRWPKSFKYSIGLVIFLYVLIDLYHCYGAYLCLTGAL